LPLAGMPILASAQSEVQTDRTGEVLTLQGRVTLQGTVADVFGNDFVLESDGQRGLVDAGPSWHRSIDVAPGDTLTISGEMDEDRSLDAHLITFEDGREVRVRSADGPPPWAGGRDDDDDRGRQARSRSDGGVAA